MENKRKRRSHSREFKLEAVRRTHEPGKTTAEVARELDISENELHEWRHQVSKKGDKVFPGAGRNKGPNKNNELAQLKKENARLREERDILKKSLIFFAKDDKKDSGL